MAGRPESPIGPDEPFADFASGLRALRAAMKMTYDEIAAETHYCVSVLSMAANGRHLPTLHVTLAYVRACQGNASEWRRRWDEERKRGDQGG